MQEFSYNLRVPKDRIAVMIGVKGKVKKELEELTQATIQIDSSEGEVLLKGEDSLKLFTLKEVIRSIGRGFNPEIAMLLLKQDYVLEVVSLSEFTPDKNHQQRLKGRVIGTDGKSREIIERLTDTYISIYGKTISIIGSSLAVLQTRKAVEMLLKGSMHSTVFRILEKYRRDTRRQELSGNAF
ncbi:MAG TPA: KH domain-containing protein [Candidatus Nanoarchaeia archaeon]|nr:KH domain-containing protein [Candidatus Nanoarchaeia archaeon]